MIRPRLALILIIAAVIAGVYSLDVLLKKAESAEVHNEAQALYNRGTKLLAGGGHASEAAELLQRAHALERSNRTYQLAYADALIAVGHYAAATDTLNDIVRDAPNDARANFLLARLARAQDDFNGETAYYHRAIYGVWDNNGSARANDTRLEWIHELVKHGDRRVLLGELLQLEAESQDPAVLRQVAHDLLVAGAPNRSAELYQALLVDHPDDAGLEEGLGQADAADGKYAFAQRDYMRALRSDPGNPAIRHDMQLTTELSEIDPTPRRLPSREKYNRSVSILKLVSDAVTACGSKAPELPAAARLVGLKKTDTSNEAAEQVLQLAQTLWRSRPAQCQAPEVLPVLMEKLAQ